MRFSYALLGIALLNGCQLTGQKDSANQGSSNSLHQSVFYVNHTSSNPRFPLNAPATQKDVWDRIAMQLSLPVPNNERVRRYRNWYIKHPQHLRIVSQRAQPFLHLITNKVEARKIPLEIALLPIVESSFDQFASSHVEAAGLWQFVPDTARRFGLLQTWWYDGRRDVVGSTDAALDLLEYLHKKFDGDWLHALAAYNTGEARVFRAIRLNERRGKSTDFWSLSLPKETSSYVPKLIAVADVLRNRNRYGVEFIPIANKPAVKLIKPATPMNLKMAARFAKISVKELHDLNPAYDRFSTSTNKMPQLLLPIDKVSQFNINLARNNNLGSLIHKVKYGDRLVKIANEYDTTVTAIQKANSLRDSNIVIGQRLVIPTADSKPQAEKRPNITNSNANLQKINYIVSDGDSLWSIAQNHQVSPILLASWNDMELDDTIHVGKTLTIYINKQSMTSKLISAVYQIKNKNAAEQAKWSA